MRVMAIQTGATLGSAARLAIGTGSGVLASAAFLGVPARDIEHFTDQASS